MDKRDYRYHHENMASQGEGFISRAQLDAEKARAAVRYRKMAEEFAAAGNEERAEYHRNLADSLDFGWEEADRRQAERRGK